jgi:predicted transcriptional regulator
VEISRKAKQPENSTPMEEIEQMKNWLLVRESHNAGRSPPLPDPTDADQ